MQTTEDDLGDLDDDAPMTLAEFRDSIRRVLDLPLGTVTRLSRYTFQARQADRYRPGRVLVAGDAAHQSPATGIGINLGMSDAANLAWKLAADIHGWAPADLLDTYHGERRLVAARAMQQTQAQVALRRGQDPAAAALRELFAEILRDEQPARRVAILIAGQTSVTRRRAPAGMPWWAPSPRTSRCVPLRASPASPSFCAAHAPSCSISRTDLTSAAPPSPGSRGSRCTPRWPTIGRPRRS